MRPSTHSPARPTRPALPVTQQEHRLADDAMLISTTDTDSRITFCNHAFIEASGYSREELLGQPHNLVRHPDMPAEAFRDLWATLRSGLPWQGLVKNRRKNGDHYWVLANAAPLRREGRTVGYVSVRTTPSREQVRAAEALYARMRADLERAGPQHLTLRLNGGQPVPTGLALWVQRLRPQWRHRTGLALLGCGLAGWLLGQWPAAALTTGSLSVWLGAGVAGGLACAALGAALGRQALGPMQIMRDTAQDWASGDLTARLPPSLFSDEWRPLAMAMQQLSVNIRAMVADIRHEVSAIEGVADEIAGDNGQLSERTESQASNLQQTAASMEQLTGKVESSTQSAQSATGVARDATQVAHSGSAVMGQVAQTMAAIQLSSQRIAEIMQVIDGISFQTNLLALNAAVEAARAGEQGRGFAIVAAEVRLLAQRTLNASREIKGLISASASTVQEGSQLVDSARGTMAGIVSAVDRVSALIRDITQSAVDQSQGIHEINAAIAHLDQVTQHNAEMVGQLSHNAGALQEQSRSVRSSVELFRV